MAEIIVAKHRNGPTGSTTSSSSTQYTKFENLAAARVTRRRPLSRTPRCGGRRRSRGARGAGAALRRARPLRGRGRAVRGGPGSSRCETGSTCWAMIGPSSSVGRHVVRGRADDLHAALVRLRVGPRPGERRQERVVDVDHPLAPRLDEPRGQHAHVAREHDDVGRGARRAARPARAPARRASVVVDRRVRRNGTPKRATSVGVRVVVRRDERDLARAARRGATRTRRSARQWPWRDASTATRGRRGEIVQRPVHGEPLRDRREPGRERRRSDVVDVELDALQEQPGRGVGVLVGLDDVAARVGHERADRGDDARTRRGTGAGVRRAVFIGGGAQKSVRSGSTSPRSRSRSISTHATPLLCGVHLGLRLDLLRDEHARRSARTADRDRAAPGSAAAGRRRRSRRRASPRPRPRGRRRRGTADRSGRCRSGTRAARARSRRGARRRAPRAAAWSSASTPSFSRPGIVAELDGRCRAAPRGSRSAAISPLGLVATIVSSASHDRARAGSSS